MNYRDYGRIGGLQTLFRYGKAHFSEIGKRGGRPRLRQQQAPRAQIQIREGLAARPNNLRVLKELYKLQQRSKPVNNENGGSESI